MLIGCRDVALLKILEGSLCSARSVYCTSHPPSHGESELLERREKIASASIHFCVYSTFACQYRSYVVSMSFTMQSTAVAITSSCPIRAELDPAPALPRLLSGLHQAQNNGSRVSLNLSISLNGLRNFMRMLNKSFTQSSVTGPSGHNSLSQLPEDGAMSDNSNSVHNGSVHVGSLRNVPEQINRSILRDPIPDRPADPQPDKPVDPDWGKCVICFTYIPNALLPCSHAFCLLCCTTLYEQGMPCPVCRYNFRTWRNFIP